MEKMDERSRIRRTRFDSEGKLSLKRGILKEKITLWNHEIERERRGIMMSSKIIIESIQEMERATESVALLLNNVWHNPLD